MVGTSGYERSKLDFYPTPLKATQGFIKTWEDDLPAMQAWEPFCGNGAISRPLGEVCRSILSTDIQAYEGFDADGLVDFFNVYADGDHFEMAVNHFEGWHDENTDEDGCCPEGPDYPMSMSDIATYKGFRPDAIISNPPYGKDAERAVRHALRLMEPERGFVAFLMRHEWDAAASRADLFDHPAFFAKITLRHRPRWIADSKGAPRFPYAWFIWDWTRPVFQRPELFYAR